MIDNVDASAFGVYPLHSPDHMHEDWKLALQLQQEQLFQVVNGKRHKHQQQHLIMTIIMVILRIMEIL